MMLLLALSTVTLAMSETRANTMQKQATETGVCSVVFPQEYKTNIVYNPLNFGYSFATISTFEEVKDLNKLLQRYAVEEVNGCTYKLSNELVSRDYLKALTTSSDYKSLVSKFKSEAFVVLDEVGQVCQDELGYTIACV